MELPTYKVPQWKNVLLTIYEKSTTFVFEAGKVIVAISIILWVLASYGPGEDFDNAEQIVRSEMPSGTEEEIENAISAYELEHSYAGVLVNLLSLP